MGWSKELPGNVWARNLLIWDWLLLPVPWALCSTQSAAVQKGSDSKYYWKQLWKHLIQSEHVNLFKAMVFLDNIFFKSLESLTIISKIDILLNNVCSTPWGLVGDYKIFILWWTASLTHLSNHFTSLYWQYTTNGRDGATNFSRPINTGQGWNRLAITNLKQTFKSASPIIRQVNH